jgi:hypothetical protein
MKYQITPFKENILLFLISFAILFGPAFALFDTYDYDMVANPDLKTYLGLAEFDFDQSPVRRYRVIVPFLASIVNTLFEPIFSRIQPWTFPGPDFSMCMSFFLVNSTLMSVFGVLLFRINLHFSVNKKAAFIGLLAVLTSRWTAYYAGLPLVESLYLVVMALLFYGILSKNNSIIILTIFLGPWAKESFIFVAPIIFFFAPLKKTKQTLYFLLSGIIVFSFRYFYDVTNQLQVMESIQKDINHVTNIQDAIKRLFSFHGIYEAFSVIGLWNLLFIALFNKTIRHELAKHTPLFFIFFLVAVFIQAILSTELARMFYLATPILAIYITLIINQLASLLAIKTK